MPSRLRKGCQELELTSGRKQSPSSPKGLPSSFQLRAQDKVLTRAKGGAAEKETPSTSLSRSCSMTWREISPKPTAGKGNRKEMLLHKRVKICSGRRKQSVRKEIDQTDAQLVLIQKAQQPSLALGTTKVFAMTPVRWQIVLGGAIRKSFIFKTTLSTSGVRSSFR